MTDRALTFDRSRLRTAMVWIVVVKCAALVIVIDPNALSAFELPKSMVSRGLAYVLVALLFMSTVEYGRQIWSGGKFLIPTVAVAVLAVAATLLSPEPQLALYGDYERFEGLTFILDMTVLSTAVAVAFRGTRDWVRLAAGLALTSLVVLVYAVCQRFGLDPIVWRYGSIDRPFATIGHPDMLGQFLSVGFGVSLALGVFGPGRPTSAIRRSALVFAFAFAAVAGIVATRASLVGLTGALFVVLLLSFFRWRAGVFRILLALTVVVAAGGALVAASPLAERARATVVDRVQLDARASIYQGAIVAIERRPWLGFGPDTFSAVFPQVRDARSTLVLAGQPQSSAHSWLFQTLVTTGAIGLVALLAAVIFATWLLLARRMRDQPWFAGSLVVGLAAYWGTGLFGVQSVAVDWVPWLVFGAAAAVAQPQVELPRLRRPVSGRVAAAACGVLAFAGVFALAAGEEAWQARLLAPRLSPLAVDHASQAVSLDPGRAEYWNLLGDAYGALGDWRVAGDAYAEAAHRQTYNSAYWASLGRARGRQLLAGDTSSGGLAAAYFAFAQGTVADPYDPVPYAALAELATRFMDGDRALAPAVRAIELYPPDISYDGLVLAASRLVSDSRSAAALVDSALAAKESWRLRVAAGELAIRNGDLATARIHANRASQLAPFEPDVRTLLTKLPPA